MSELDIELNDLEQDELKEAPKGVPYPLWKATYDSFDYLVGLKNGTFFRFGEAIIFGDWVRLDEITNHNVPMDCCTTRDFDRGVYVKLSEISFVADAPQGS